VKLLIADTCVFAFSTRLMKNKMMTMLLIWLCCVCRALRILRVASKLQGIGIVVTSILKAIPAVGDVVLVGLLFYFIFSVLSVNLLLGGMHSCTDSSAGDMLDAYYLLPEGNTINKTW
jgi:hypothetical protein